MSVLDDAMREHMGYKILIERLPVCYKDFLNFEVNGIKYGMTHGTFRNKIGSMIKNGEVEVLLPSNPFFYTLKGHRFVNAKPMTRKHMVVSNNNSFYKLISDLPLNKQSIHNIRLKFIVSNIWDFFVKNFSYSKNSKSQDIAIPSIGIDDIICRITIHKSNTVSISLGSSLNPIPLDGQGLIFLSTTLTRIEERISNIIQSVNETNIKIHKYLEWIVIMWHFGRDSLNEYTGEKFSITFEESQACILRAYVKETTKTTKNIIRLEKQEYPNKKTQDIINERLNQNNNDSIWIKNIDN
jgi:hypothetical protein